MSGLKTQVLADADAVAREAAKFITVEARAVSAVRGGIRQEQPSVIAGRAAAGELA